MSIAVIAGLGNPGSRYEGTRHNIGFEFLDYCVSRHGGTWKLERRFEAQVATFVYEGRRILCAKPTTYMNSSGRALGALLRYRRVDSNSLIVAYDDLNLDVGRLKLSAQGSAGGHNGIVSIIEEVGFDFARFRLGIGQKPNKDMDLADYVLAPFSSNETSLFKEQFPNYLEALNIILADGVTSAMNTINQRTVTKHERSDQEQL